MSHDNQSIGFICCGKCRKQVVANSASVRSGLCADCTPEPQMFKMSEGYNDGRRP